MCSVFDVVAQFTILFSKNPFERITKYYKLVRANCCVVLNNSQNNLLNYKLTDSTLFFQFKSFAWK